MSEPVRKPDNTPESYRPGERPEIIETADKKLRERSRHPAENLIQTINYKGADFEVVLRPEVLWVGCVDYAKDNSGESDISATLKRFQGLVFSAPIREKMNPDWSASLSINYTRADRPCGIMFANEALSDDQDERYDKFVQPGGLWLRVRNDKDSAKALLGKEKAEPWEYFAGDSAPLQSAARENGYIQNPDVPIQIEYHCHAEYDTPPHTNFAYIPIIRPEDYKPSEKPEIIRAAENEIKEARDEEMKREHIVELESVRYVDIPASRFIGKDVMGGPSDYGAMWGRSGEFMPVLGAMAECLPEIADPCALMHFSNRKHDRPGGEMHYIVGRFMKAGAPVPDGFDFWDMAPATIGLAVVRGEFNDMIEKIMMLAYKKFTADGYEITYPENYFHAEVYIKENIPEAGVVSKLGYIHSCRKKDGRD